MTEPEYTPLQGHTVPAGYRQLADHELLQKGDLYLDTAIDPDRPNGVKVAPIPWYCQGRSAGGLKDYGAFFREV